MTRLKHASIATLVLPAWVFLGCAAGADTKANTPVEELIVWADADPDSGKAPLTVELSCDPLEDIDQPKYSWDPGDGSAALEGQQVTHTYARPGNYKARVTVRDSAGNLGNDDADIEVEPAPK